jgi:hypothetical protein
MAGRELPDAITAAPLKAAANFAITCLFNVCPFGCHSSFSIEKPNDGYL